MTTIRNPILPGFNPDPSICRVGDDYYIATSTFEWYPGVQIHHSRDLVNWRLVRRPLDRASQLDMRGDPDSGGVWAPCLSYADGRFWLVYTDVKRFDGNFKDAHNYIVTAPAIEGPWSDPTYVNSSGFDPSLFHDDDGRKWFVNMIWNHRARPRRAPRKHPAFVGILPAGMGRRLRQARRRADEHLRRQRARPRRRPASLQAQRLVLSDDRRGRHRLRPRGDDGALAPDRRPLRAAPERPSPHVEGRARRARCSAPATARSSKRRTVRSITRISARGRCRACRRSPLGRETAIQKCVWGDDGWLYLAQGGQVPAVEVPALAATEAEAQRRLAEPYDFSPGGAAARLPVAAHAASRADLLALGPPGLAAPDRPRIDRLVVRAGARRAPAGAFRLSRRDGARFPAVDISAGGRPRRPTTTATSSISWRSPGTRALGRVADDPELRGRLSRGPPELPARLADPARRRGSGAARRIGRSREASVRLRLGRRGRVARRRTRPRRLDPVGRSRRRRASARSPAPSSAWSPSISRAARSTPTSGISSTRNA